MTKTNLAVAIVAAAIAASTKADECPLPNLLNPDNLEKLVQSYNYLQRCVRFNDSLKFATFVERYAALFPDQDTSYE